ncbi:MAG TPA: Ig-like domain-containing protein [Gemmatimonadales bacterium]|nr:Ig-like domain-containing protein [Gemmatimonadales bacterium]
MNRFALVPPAAAALVVGLLGCGDNLTLPGPTQTGLELTVLGGNGQIGTVGQELEKPVVVVVLNAARLPVPNRKVVFAPTGTATGAFDPDTAMTDAQGKALTHWVLGTVPGSYTGEARVVPLDDSIPAPVPFEATANAGSPDSVRADSPTIQNGRRGEPVDQPLVVKVVDRYGNPVPNVQVTWRAELGNGDLSPASGNVTDADGRCGVVWTLGNRIGIQQVTAEIPDLIGSPVTFSATVLF